MEHYALEYETKTAIRITQSHIAYTKPQDSPERRGEDGTSRAARPFLAYDNTRMPLERREHETQAVATGPPAYGQLILVPPWNIRGSPYEQASFAYRRVQMLMEEGIPHVLDIWA